MVSEPEIDHVAGPTGFSVDVPGFTGPFRLLADLILEQKVDVCDVPIASVTDTFLAKPARPSSEALSMTSTSA